MNAIQDYLGNLDALLLTVEEGKDSYIQPALKNLGSVAIPIIREVISPASFRNADPEITDIEVDDVRRVRAVANKFKFGERARGLQVLRMFGAGGRMPQNRSALGDKERPSTVFDLNTIVFGDSAVRGGDVLPIKAAVSYSDAISLYPYAECVGSSFHNRASEDGSLFDPQTKRNSVNLFERHFIKPGTLLLQVLAMNGRTAPSEALDHLLLSIGLAGAYGGQTSVYGVNVRNHIVGIYAGRLERAVASPYVALREAAPHCIDGWAKEVTAAIAVIDQVVSAAYPVRIDSAAVADHQAKMIAALEADDSELRRRYLLNAEKIGAFFDGWFHKV